MGGAGDYTHYKDLYSDKTVDIDLAATDAGKDNVIVVKSANHQIWVQKISYSVITAAAQPVTFQDDASTPVKITVVPASQATSVVIDFGPKGVPLTIGKNLDISNTAGPAAKIHIEAYEKLRSDGVGISYLAGSSLQ
jgi:hypothetical protein